MKSKRFSPCAALFALLVLVSTHAHGGEFEYYRPWENEDGSTSRYREAAGWIDGARMDDKDTSVILFGSYPKKSYSWDGPIFGAKFDSFGEAKLIALKMKPNQFEFTLKSEVDFKGYWKDEHAPHRASDIVATNIETGESHTLAEWAQRYEVQPSLDLFMAQPTTGQITLGSGPTQISITDPNVKTPTEVITLRGNGTQPDITLHMSAAVSCADPNLSP